MIRVGLIGFGLAGSAFHAPFLTERFGFRLTAIASRRREEISRDYPQARACGVTDIMRSSDIDLVVVATPNDTHASLARVALESGKSVVVDKPLATSSSEAADLFALAERRGLVLCAYQNRRWDDDFLTLKRLADEGTLGEIVSLESRFDRYRPAVADRWRERPGPGAGLWWDLGAHLLDQVVALMGPPDGIHGDLACQRRGAQVDDYFHVVLRYGERQAILSAGCLVTSPTPRFRVEGMCAAFVSHDLDPQEERLRALASGLPLPGPQSRCANLYAWEEGRRVARALPLDKGDYGLFYAAIREAILGHGPAPVSADATLRTLRLLEFDAGP